jgi:membrane-bound lytic murein transglycosylase B
MLLRALPLALLIPSLWVCATALPSAQGEQASEPVPATVPAGAVVPESAPVRQPFDEWLAGVREEALARGISAPTLDAALAGLEPLPIVVERDRAQAEFTFTLDGYIKRRLTRPMVRDTRRAYARHRTLLRKVGARYDVTPTILASIWALESNLGRFSGVRPTVATLATLAWDGRRPFFRSELLDALTIVDRGDIELAAMKGSWAGAMGQPQFMPSSYLRHAQDFDGDGRKDIWRSHGDVFASIAAYLKDRGWNGRQTWGREVRLPRDMTAITAAAPLRAEGCRAFRGMTVPLPLARWHALGVRRVDGRRLPTAEMDASLVRGETRAFLVYGNYEAILGYNCAHAYALSVGLLSESLQR